MGQFKCLLLVTAMAAAVGASAWSPSAIPVQGVLMVATKPPVRSSTAENSLRNRYSRDLSLDSLDWHTTTIASSSPEARLVPLFTEMAEYKVESPRISHIMTAATVVVSTVLTFVLNNHAAMGQVGSTMATTALSYLMLPEKLCVAAVCGSFAGMARTAVIPTFGASLVLGGACAAMMALFDRKKWLMGVGGRTAFVAQCACTLQFLVSALFMSPAANAGIVGPCPSATSLIKQFPYVALFTTIGAFFMNLWNEVFEEENQNANEHELDGDIFKRMANSFIAVGPTGLLAALPSAAVGPAFCGSFIAMSCQKTRLRSTRSLLGASIMASVIQQVMSGTLVGGWGGRLGTLALVGTLSYTALEKFLGLAKQPERFVQPIFEMHQHRAAPMQPGWVG